MVTAGYDIVKFEKVYRSMSAALAMYTFSKIIEKKNSETKERYRIVFMQMDWIAKCFAGEDTGLLEKFEETVAVADAAAGETGEAVAGAVAVAVAAPGMTEDKENSLISNLAKLGFKINKPKR